MFQIMKLFCLMGGLSDPHAEAPLASEALRLATLGGARSAGAADRLGAIRPGMRADMVALDLSDPAYRPLNHLVRQVVYAETGRSVRHVWVDGRRVVRNGVSALVDEKELDALLAKMMPDVRRELDRLRARSDEIHTAMAEIQRRAWEADLGYDRYLQRC